MIFQTLVVEDEPKAQQLILNLTQTFFEEIQIAGFAHSVAEAISVLEKELIQLVFLDIHLYGENGLEVLDFIRQKKLPIHVIITTANSEYEGVCQLSERTHFLLKPIQINDLKNILHHITQTNIN